MEEELLIHIGKKIKLYRKAKNLTLVDLAKIINKSKATVSKYESGNISIDIGTLYDIANALDIDINQLAYYSSPNRNNSHPFTKNPFGNTDILYLYIYNGMKKRIWNSVMKLYFNNDAKKIEATLFMNIASYSDYENCELLYRGEMKSFDRVTNFILENQYAPLEQLMINIIYPMKEFDQAFGLLSSISSDPFVPVSFKVLLSKKILHHNEELTNVLVLSKNDLKKIKTMNFFTIDLESI